MWDVAERSTQCHARQGLWQAQQMVLEHRAEDDRTASSHHSPGQTPGTVHCRHLLCHHPLSHAAVVGSVTMVTCVVCRSRSCLLRQAGDRLELVAGRCMLSNDVLLYVLTTTGLLMFYIYYTIITFAVV